MGDAHRPLYTSVSNISIVCQTQDQIYLGWMDNTGIATIIAKLGDVSRTVLDIEADIIRKISPPTVGARKLVCSFHAVNMPPGLGKFIERHFFAVGKKMLTRLVVDKGLRKWARILDCRDEGYLAIGS